MISVLLASNVVVFIRGSCDCARLYFRRLFLRWQSLLLRLSHRL